MSTQQTWRQSDTRSVNSKYMCCGVEATAVNHNGNVDRVCPKCGTLVYDGGIPHKEAQAS